MDTPEQQSRSIAFVISEELKEAGISQRETSARTGIPLTTLNRRLNTQSSFLVSELETLATLLKTTVSALFERAEATNQSGNAA